MLLLHRTSVIQPQNQSSKTVHQNVMAMVKTQVVALAVVQVVVQVVAQVDLVRLHPQALIMQQFHWVQLGPWQVSQQLCVLLLRLLQHML